MAPLQLVPAGLQLAPFAGVESPQVFPVLFVQGARNPPKGKHSVHLPQAEAQFLEVEQKLQVLQGPHAEVLLLAVGLRNEQPLADVEPDSVHRDPSATGNLPDSQSTLPLPDPRLPRPPLQRSS